MKHIRLARLEGGAHPKIADKIHELVNENITSPDVVRKCLEVLQRSSSLEGPTEDITQAGWTYTAILLGQSVQPSLAAMTRKH